MFLIGEKKLDQDEKKDRDQKGIIMEALSYLFSAYSHKRRRLGPMAVLHPLRATALFTRTFDKLDFVDILYQNKPLMLEASVAFIVIFLSFLNDPAYYVKGISAKGIYPK
jgi:hypothetical protein